MIVRQRYNPNVDQAFNQLTRSFFETASRPVGPSLKGSWVDDAYVITVDLPGVPAEAVSVDVAGDQLHLVVDTDDTKLDRKLRLNNKLDSGKVAARHVDGRLTITIGQHDAPETRSVAIDTTPAAPAIEVSGDEVVDAATQNSDES